MRGLGPCRSGCEDLDNYVLLAGGFERGSVVGISAEDEDGVGVMVSFAEERDIYILYPYKAWNSQ